MSTPNQPYPSLVLIQQILTRYGYPCVVVLGTVGNILNIVLFLRKTLRTISCNNYFLASAFVNLVILSVGIIPLLYVTDRPWAITSTYCKARSYLFNASQQTSRFLIVAACFDRFALCSTSARLRQFCRLHIARYYVIPLIIITWLTMPIYMLIFGTATNNSCTFPGASTLYNSIYGITLVGFLPPSLMSIFSLLTFHNLKSRQQRRQVHPFIITKTNLPAREIRKQQKKDQQVLGMLMIQVFVYVCTTSTSSINLLYSTLTMYLGVNKSNERRAIESFISFMTGILNYSCPCLSFYLFILASRLYRKQMKLVIQQVCRRFYFVCIANINTNSSHNTTDAGHSIQLHTMTARVQPAPQPSVAPLSSMAHGD